MKLVAAAALLAVPLLSACPKPRTSAATQPSPAAFDLGKSDPKAVAVVDAGMTALGGYDKWDGLKELRFGVHNVVNGEVVSEFEHAWDRWNGRHYFAVTDPATLKGKPEDMKTTEVKHDLFDKDASPWAAYDGSPIMRSDAKAQAVLATKQLTADLYYLALIYKIKDPGAILAVDNVEMRIPDEVPACKPSCTSIKLTFEKGVGTDTWYVDYNNETRLPDVIELQRGAGRVGYLLSDWVEAGGLKWPGKVSNIGAKGAEDREFLDVRVGEPDASRYEVQVR